jgi:PEGA domain
MVGHRPSARLLFVLGMVALGSGCVERRFTVRTDPPGAVVTVNGEEVGTSPVSVPFTYYGVRRVKAEAEGYNTLNIEQPIKAPWWDNLATEFVTENMVPFTLRDEREFNYRLTPASTPETGDLVGRAEQLRSAGTTPPPKKRTGIAAWLGF